jgi:hypothetical protein
VPHLFDRVSIFDLVTSAEARLREDFRSGTRSNQLPVFVKRASTVVGADHAS